MLKSILQVFRSKNTKDNLANPTYSSPPPNSKKSTVLIEKDISSNKAKLKDRLKTSSDIIFYEFEGKSENRFLLVYLDGFVDNEILNNDIIRPLMNDEQSNDLRKCLYISNIKEITILDQAIEAILEGKVLLYRNGQIKAYVLDLKKWEHRVVEEASNEAVVRGPKEGFVEYLQTNIVLLRRKIKSPNLVIEKQTLGRQTKTEIALAYLDGIVNREVLTEARKRLNEIDTDSILESGYIEQYIEDARYSPYPTIGNTQKPDVVAGKLLEGRVAIFCDGTPHVLTVPFIYVESLQTSEDYYVRSIMGSILRLIRLLGLILSTLLPAIYVALTSFHQEMIPNVLLISFAGAEEGIPLPVLAETFVMGVMFELLRESGTRLPRAIGSAISIVGALVIGEAAVTAGLVSAPVVIVTAVTAVSSFVIPALTGAMIVFRFIFLLLGGVMGLPGITCGIFFVFIYTVSIRSFGIPYTSSMSPASTGNFKDVFLRYPLSSMRKRPDFLANRNKKRRGGG